tara:strand:+ start:1369 stop:1791 length:423 start_codon:yes stop_codon:yes gene_type:complete
MNEQKLRSNIRKLLFEDQWVDTSADNETLTKFAVDTTEDPIEPETHMATQLSVAAPPVNDEDYLPTSSVDLSKALEALFKDTPSDQLEYVYRQAHKLRSFAEEKSRRFRVSEPKIDDTIPLKKPVRKSTKIPKKVKKSLK